jgi:hypothetical protein
MTAPRITAEEIADWIAWSRRVVETHGDRADARCRVIAQLAAELDRLSAQGWDVPDLTDDEIDSRTYRQPAGPCDDEDWARWSHRECRWAYHLALSRVRAQAQPATERKGT